MNAEPRMVLRGMTILARRLALLTVAMALAFAQTGCVQSVYPWHVDEDVVFDANLAGAWIGEGDAEGCLLSITGDPAREVRHYNVEMTKYSPEGCPDFGESSKWSAGGQLVQIGQQRFVEVWEDKCRSVHAFQNNHRLANNDACAAEF